MATGMHSFLCLAILCVMASKILRDGFSTRSAADDEFFIREFNLGELCSGGSETTEPTRPTDTARAHGSWFSRPPTK
jgi:hypothetical protein